MDDNFRKGFVLGMAMQPLYVVTQQPSAGVSDSETPAPSFSMLEAEMISEYIKAAEIPEGSKE